MQAYLLTAVLLKMVPLDVKPTDW